MGGGGGGTKHRYRSKREYGKVGSTSALESTLFVHDVCMCVRGLPSVQALWHKPVQPINTSDRNMYPFLLTQSITESRGRDQGYGVTEKGSIGLRVETLTSENEKMVKGGLSHSYIFALWTITLGNDE